MGQEGALGAGTWGPRRLTHPTERCLQCLLWHFKERS